MPTAPTKSYRIAPELRRCCFYVIAGAFFLTLVACAIAIDWQRAMVACIVFAILAVAMLPPLCWRLRVTERGIERRRAIWTDFWSWDELNSGRIQKRHPIVLVDPARPWWRRRLNLEYVGNDALQELIVVVNTHFRLPPAPDLPDELHLKVRFARLHLDRHGVRWETRRQIQQYLWNEVGRVHITRVDPLRRDFRRLVFELPQGDVKLEMHIVHGQAIEGWRGADAETLNEFVFHHLPEDCIDVDISGERPASRQDVEKQIAEAAGKVRAMNWIACFLVVFMACWTGWFIALNGIVGGLLAGTSMSLIVLMFHGSVIWFMRRDWRRKIARLREMQGEFDAGEPYGLPQRSRA